MGACYMYTHINDPYPKKFGVLTLKSMLLLLNPNTNPPLMKSKLILRQYVNPVPVLSSVKILTSYSHKILTTKPLIEMTNYFPLHF